MTELNAFTKSLNISVMPEYPQSDGPSQVLDNLQARTGATSITTSPYVMEPSNESDAGREPPADGKAGAVRLLDRDLFGKRELTVRTSPSFAPNKSLYKGLRYQPAEADALTRREGSRISQFISQAQSYGMQAYMQVQSAIPPGYKVQFGGAVPEDRPLLPDGSEHEGRVDKNASLASPHITDYGCALLRDLIQAYPNLDGLRVDWPEYPPYAFDSLFFDFSGHAEAAAMRLGYDFERMRVDTKRLLHFLLVTMTDDHISRFLESNDFFVWEVLNNYPGVLDLKSFKGDLVSEMLGKYRRTIDEASSGKMDFVVQGFPPPWTQASGFDIKKLALHVSGIGIKLYTMHWPMMVRGYADRILASNSDVSEAVLLMGIFKILDVLDGAAPTQIKDVRYPEPDEPHMAGIQAQARKILETRKLAGDTPIHAFSHAYGPMDDYRARMKVAWEASGHRMVVNRYGYLSDEKLDVLGEITGMNTS
jgi:hypothetical protein